MSAHLGRTSKHEKITAHFFWYGIYNDVTDQIQKCDRCQRQNSLPPILNNEMHSVPVSPHVMKQVGLDLCFLPKVCDYRHLIVCIDYFAKFLEAKTIRDIITLMVATFLYELICCHGCFEAQINKQGKEFVTGVRTCSNDLADAEQLIT